MHSHAAKPSLFVALVHETLKQASYETRGDLVEAVKRRAARLRLRYDSALVGDAIDQVERVRGPLWPTSPSGPVPREGRAPEVAPVDRRAAAELLTRLGCGSIIKTMGSEAEDAAHEARVRAQAVLLRREATQSTRRRRPLRDRLEAI